MDWLYDSQIERRYLKEYKKETFTQSDKQRFGKTTRFRPACKAAAMGGKQIAVRNSGAGAFLGKIAVLSSNNGVKLRKIPKKYRNAEAFLRKIA